MSVQGDDGVQPSLRLIRCSPTLSRQHALGFSTAWPSPNQAVPCPLLFLPPEHFALYPPRHQDLSQTGSAQRKAEVPSSAWHIPGSPCCGLWVAGLQGTLSSTAGDFRLPPRSPSCPALLRSAGRVWDSPPREVGSRNASEAAEKSSAMSLKVKHPLN